MPNDKAQFGKTAPLPRPNDLRSRYGLPPLPKAVEKIAGLARAKSDAPMDEIVEMIDADQATSKNLIRMAYPRPAARIDATVQMATSRLGVNRVIVVLVGDLLRQAVRETFLTMFNVELNEEDETAIPMSGVEMWTGSVRFSGENNGEVTLAFSRPLSLLCVAHLLGGTLDDRYPPDVITDAVGEIVNMVTGSLQSRLTDAGFPSDVEVPVVKLRSSLPKETIPGGTNDQFLFRQGIYRVGVNLCIAPFASA